MLAGAELRVVHDPIALRNSALGLVLARAEEALARRGVFHLALSGGSTPRALYLALAERVPDPGRWQVYFCDERCVPPDHPESNYRLVREAWLERAPRPPAQVHRLHGEDDPGSAASAYERVLRASLGAPPRLDLALLGLGADGHTASLFPGSSALAERERLVVRGDGPPPLRQRLTLTVPALELAREIIFLVAGAEKAEALRATLEPRPDEPASPARAVALAAPRVLWLVDSAAAALLGRSA